MKHTTDHMAAIKAGVVTRTNVIGLRKIINADARRRYDLDVSPTCPKYTHAEVEALESALAKHEPRVTGALHDTGVKLLQSPRYRKRLADVAHIVAKLDSFRLVSFDRIGNHGLQSIPVYRACAGRKSFLFRNIPWQSGGNGPEVMD